MESKKPQESADQSHGLETIPQLKGSSSSIIKDLQESQISSNPYASNKKISEVKQSLSLHDEPDDIEPIPMKKNHNIESLEIKDDLINEINLNEKKEEEKEKRH